MTDQISNPYDVVLADLRAKRDEIDRAIELLTRVRGGHSGPRPEDDPKVMQEPQNHAGMFLGMSIPDAAVKLLTIRKRKMTSAEIYKELADGGMVLTSKDPINVVGSVLTRRFNAIGDIVRIDRGTWGLKAWYPGRNFNKAKVPDEVVAEVNLADLGLDLSDDIPVPVPPSGVSIQELLGGDTDSDEIPF